MAKRKVLTTDKDIEKALAEAASTPEEPIVSEVYLENIGGGVAIDRLISWFMPTAR